MRSRPLRVLVFVCVYENWSIQVAVLILFLKTEDKIYKRDKILFFSFVNEMRKGLRTEAVPFPKTKYEKENSLSVLETRRGRA